jgi:hypothetical protein
MKRWKQWLFLRRIYNLNLVERDLIPVTVLICPLATNNFDSLDQKEFTLGYHASAVTLA